MMMAKLRRILFVLAAILSLALLISGCGHEHDYDDWFVTKEATCVEDGSKTRICMICGYEDTEKIPGAGSHKYNEKISIEATCKEQGMKSFTCSVCSHTYTERYSAATYTASELYEMILQSVGEIVTYDQNGNKLALGTGFVSNSSGKIVTNYHVIENAYSATITINGTRYSIAQVLAYDKKIDIAVLQISARDLPAVTMCERSHRVGEVVYAFGSSQGLTGTLSEGIITYSDRFLDGVSYTQHDAPISSGNSGGPLINKYGEVIGINTWTVQNSQNLNFAINISELDDLKYGTPLTMAEFYEKECGAFMRLKNYIIKNGKYDDEDDCYRMIIGVGYPSDRSSEYTRMAYYYPYDNVITLDFIVDDAKYWIYIEIDSSLSGVYTWWYFDDNQYTMSGPLYASTFNENTNLTYSDYDAPSGLINSIRNLSSSMIAALCVTLDSDLSAIGITAKDLGFLLF